LRASGHFVHDSGHFAETDYFAIGEVADMSSSVKRKEMVFAHAVKFDVLEQYDLVVALGENTLEVNTGVFVESRKNFRIHSSDSGRGF
jgi:hypothetical protein